MNSPRPEAWTGPAISIEDLSFAYRGSEQKALAGINLELRDGQFAVIMGHGGAGKSTLCYCLNALIPKFFKGSYEGRVLVKGIEAGTSKVYDMSRLVGLVFQDFESQLFSTNVELEVAFGPENYGVPREEIRRRVDRYLTFVRLAELRNREPASLSGGQKQRLAIASVLAMEPEILVMDEPTTDLDPIGRDEVLSVAEELERQGRTLLIVDHEPETAQGADLVFLMKEGHLVRQGPPREVLTDVPLVLDCGVMPPQVVELFHRLDGPELPWTVEEALHLFREARLRLKPGAHDLLRGMDATRAGRVRDEVILETRGLGFVYEEGRVEALRDVDLRIRAGEFVAIIGQNGSGKTTLAKQFNGLLHPTRGEVLVDGASTRALSRAALARAVGYVFQNPDHQIFARTVREEVAFGPRNFGMDEAEIEERVAEALRVVGLEGYEIGRA
ncbi:MAG TPA: ABC transporter ATP-binding protein, partial [Anaerolineae bacterium]|nr:ABC transporter ATP-binding protein [Anaerolineae bacterium]